MPAAGLQLPVYRDDVAAGRGDEIFLFCGERGAAAQCLHQRCLLRHGTAKTRRVQVDDAARKLRATGRIVDRKIQGSVYHVARGIGQLLRPHAEPHGVQAGIALPQTQAAVFAV